MQASDGIIVHLQADLSTIMDRLARSEGSRPLAKGLDQEAIRDQLRERWPYYERAHISLSSDEGSPEELARKLLKAHER
jgi:shikimate kinase